jgi:hypothetical protein
MPLCTSVFLQGFVDESTSRLVLPVDELTFLNTVFGPFVRIIVLSLRPPC